MTEHEPQTAAEVIKWREWKPMPSVEQTESDKDSWHVHRWRAGDSIKDSNPYEQIFFMHAEKEEVQECCDYLNALEAAVPAAGLFDAIKHGDKQHQTWLKEAIECWTEGRPVPPPVMSKPVPGVPTAAVVEAVELVLELALWDPDLANEEGQAAIAAVRAWLDSLPQGGGR